MPAVLNTMFIVSDPAPPSTVSSPCNVCVELAFRPALIVSPAAVPVIVSIPAVRLSVSATAVVVVVVEVVVVDEPPQAASDSAIIEMPPAFAAFLAFLDSQALTSLLVAFIIIGYEKYFYISGNTDISSRLTLSCNKILKVSGGKMNVNRYIIIDFSLLQNILIG